MSFPTPTSVVLLFVIASLVLFVVVVQARYLRKLGARQTEELRRTRDFYQMVLDSVADPIFLKDAQHRWTWGNQAFDAILGRKSEDYVGLSDYDLFPKDMADAFWARDDYVLRVGTIDENEERIQKPDGSVGVILTKKTPIRDPWGNPTLVGVIRDITERKRDEQYIRAVIDAIPGHLSWIGRDLVYKGANRALATAWGMTPEQFQGFEAGALMKNSDRYTTYLRDFFASPQQMMEGELTLAFPDRERTFLSSIRKFNEGQEAVMIAVDITDKQDLIHEIEQTRISAIAANKMASLGEMAGSIAHEINNPLAVINGRLDQLGMSLDHDFSPESIRKSLADIKKMVLRIHRIVDGLRKISRDATLDPFENTSLLSIIDDTLVLCVARFQNTGIDLRYRAPSADAADWTLECRPIQISQVVMNLLNNGFDAVERIEERWVSLEVLPPAHGRVVLSITDSGPGIPPLLREKLMQPFFTTKGVGKGTGLGLSICRSIVASHGGKLYLDESSPRTRFVVELPLRHSS